RTACEKGKPKETTPVNVNISSAPAATPPVALVRDSTDRAFKADVIDASLEAPVLVDFWAPWCGPCRSLSPNIEKVVKEKAGKIRLVKIHIDEIQNALTAAKEGLAAGDLNTAAQIYGMVLQHQPENAEALLGMARVYLKAGEAEQAQAVFGTIPEAARKGADYTSLAAELKLLTEAAAVGGTADLARKVEKAPDDHQARYDLAIALNAEGKRVEAAEQLVTLMKRDRTWNDDGARKKLLEFFEA